MAHCKTLPEQTRQLKKIPGIVEGGQKPLRYPKLRAGGHFLSFLVDVYLAIVLSLSQFIGLTLFILASYAYSIYYKSPEAKH